MSHDATDHDCRGGVPGDIYPLTTPESLTPTKAVEHIEAVLQPRGRCTECGGGESYWKHGMGDPLVHHPFQVPYPETLTSTDQLNAELRGQPIPFLVDGKIVYTQQATLERMLKKVGCSCWGLAEDGYHSYNCPLVPTSNPLRAALDRAKAIDVLPFYDDSGSDAFNSDAYREAIVRAVLATNIPTTGEK